MLKNGDDTVVCTRQDQKDSDTIRRGGGVCKASVFLRRRCTGGSGNSVATWITTDSEESGTRYPTRGCLMIISLFLKGCRDVQQAVHVRMCVIVGERAVG